MFYYNNDFIDICKQCRCLRYNFIKKQKTVFLIYPVNNIEFSKIKNEHLTSWFVDWGMGNI